MNIEWIGGEPTTRENILSLEKSEKIKLPRVYKETILLHNAASPIPETIDCENLQFEVNNLLDINGDECNSIIFAKDILNDNGHTNLLPFAADSFGNYFCFNLLSNNSVVFWSNEDNSIHNLCETFEEFLGKLY